MFTKKYCFKKNNDMLNPTQNMPTTKTSTEEWVSWHQELKNRYGTKTANQLWVTAWRRFGNNSKNTSNLRSYLKGNGLTIEESAWDSLVDAGDSVSDFFGDIFTVGKYAGIAIAVIAIGGAGMLVFNIARKPAESVAVASKVFLTKGI